MEFLNFFLKRCYRLFALKFLLNICGFLLLFGPKNFNFSINGFQQLYYMFVQWVICLLHLQLFTCRAADAATLPDDVNTRMWVMGKGAIHEANLLVLEPSCCLPV